MLNNKNNLHRKHPTRGNQSNRMKLYHVDNTFMHFFKESQLSERCKRPIMTLIQEIEYISALIQTII